jgi:hypothetical protein
MALVDRLGKSSACVCVVVGHGALALVDQRREALVGQATV